MEYKKAKPVKSSRALKSEKAAQFGDHAAPTKPPRKFPKLGPATQAGQPELAPKNLKFRKGEII